LATRGLPNVMQRMSAYGYSMAAQAAAAHKHQQLSRRAQESSTVLFEKEYTLRHLFKTLAIATAAHSKAHIRRLLGSQVARQSRRCRPLQQRPAHQLLLCSAHKGGELQARKDRSKTVRERTQSGKGAAKTVAGAKDAGGRASPRQLRQHLGQVHVRALLVHHRRKLLQKACARAERKRGSALRGPTRVTCCRAWAAGDSDENLTTWGGNRGMCREEPHPMQHSLARNRTGGGPVCALAPG
jgi:hypothetical protein